MLTSRGTLGEVKREGQAFTAELRGLGRPAVAGERPALHRDCTADLGDARCKVDLDRSGAVTAPARSRRSRHVDLHGLRPRWLRRGWFTGGRLDAGPAAPMPASRSRSSSIASRRSSRGCRCGRRCRSRSRRAMLSRSPPAATSASPPAATASATRVNFRGFPQIPGNDFVVSYADAGAPGNTLNRLTR